MHNRVKSNVPVSEAEAKALKEKAITYNALVNLVLTKRKQQACDKDTLLVISKLSKLNPDFYSLWNFRREILLHQYPSLSQTDEKLDNQELRAMELDVTTEAIKRNPKSCK
jgi:geranylgeranyl transferase type-2 subunit alpha